MVISILILNCYNYIFREKIDIVSNLKCRYRPPLLSMIFSRTYLHDQRNSLPHYRKHPWDCVDCCMKKENGSSCICRQPFEQSRLTHRPMSGEIVPNTLITDYCLVFTTGNIWIPKYATFSPNS